MTKVPRPLTLADLQKAQRKYVSQQAMGKWVNYPEAFRVEEKYWHDLLVKLHVTDGASILELGAGKTSLITALGGGVYYQWIDEDARIARLQADVYPEGQFTAMPVETLVNGEPTQTATLVLVYLDTMPVRLPKNPCFERVDTPNSGWVRLQAGYKSLRDEGYLLVLGKPSEAQMDWLADKVQFHYTGRLGTEGILITQKVARPILCAPSTVMPDVLPPVSSVSSDPRPLVIKPWDIKMKQARPNKAEFTSVVRYGAKVGMAFSNDTDAQVWAGGILTTQSDASWKNAVAKATDKLEIKNYMRLKAEGRTIQNLMGMPEDWSIPESLAVVQHTKRLGNRLKRDGLSYPEVNDPVRQYYALGIGCTVIAPTGEQLVVVATECSITEPPKLTLELKP